MMEKLGQAKTHLELKKMISEVDRENRGNMIFLLLLLSFNGLTGLSSIRT